MFSRYFVTYFIVALFAVAIVSIRADEEVDEVEQRNPLVAAGVRILGRVFVKMAKNCLEEAAQNCRQHLKNPNELIKCAGKFFKQNKGRCVL